MRWKQPTIRLLYYWQRPGLDARRACELALLNGHIRRMK